MPKTLAVGLAYPTMCGLQTSALEMKDGEFVGRVGDAEVTWDHLGEMVGCEGANPFDINFDTDAPRADEPLFVAMARVRAALAPVMDWYQADTQPPVPLLSILKDIVADLQKDREELMRLREQTMPNRADPAPAYNDLAISPKVVDRLERFLCDITHPQLRAEGLRNKAQLFEDMVLDMARRAHECRRILSDAQLTPSPSPGYGTASPESEAFHEECNRIAKVNHTLRLNAARAKKEGLDLDQ